MGSHLVDEQQIEIRECYERRLQERQQLATPEDFQNGNESEDSEDHLNITLEQINNEEGADQQQSPEDSGEHQ